MEPSMWFWVSTSGLLLNSLGRLIEKKHKNKAFYDRTKRFDCRVDKYVNYKRIVKMLENTRFVSQHNLFLAQYTEPCHHTNFWIQPKRQITNSRKYGGYGISP